MCRKCEEMLCFGSIGHVENLSFGLVAHFVETIIILRWGKPNLQLILLLLPPAWISGLSQKYSDLKYNTLTVKMYP